MSTISSTTVGGLLPTVRLVGADGAPVALRPIGRLARVLITVHADCLQCAAYVEDLAARTSDIEEWNGHVVVAAPGESIASVPVGAAPVFRPAADPDDVLGAAGIPVPGVVVADQWGEVVVIDGAGSAHEFMAPDDVVGWVRFIAIQCPECEGGDGGGAR